MRLIDADALIAESLKPGAYNYVDTWQIANAPTIDPVRHGRWMPHKTKSGKNWWKCNICGTVSEHKTQHYFCHFCGAKMDLKGEDDGKGR